MWEPALRSTHEYTQNFLWKYWSNSLKTELCRFWNVLEKCLVAPNCKLSEGKRHLHSLDSPQGLAHSAEQIKKRMDAPKAQLQADWRGIIMLLIWCPTNLYWKVAIKCRVARNCALIWRESHLKTIDNCCGFFKIHWAFLRLIRFSIWSCINEDEWTAHVLVSLSWYWQPQPSSLKETLS